MRVRNKRHAVKTSPRILHSSPAEEKKLGFPFPENGPSAIQGEGAMSSFSDLREWEERGVTTPNTSICICVYAPNGLGWGFMALT
jgi:hypothetical protein